MKTKKELKPILLFEEVWRCGSDGHDSRGVGETLLLNKEGYMCCLGQVSLQVGAKEKNIISCCSPASTDKKLKSLTFMEFGYCINSDLSEEAMAINDYRRTTVKEKVKSLTKLFKKHGYELIFIPR